MIARCRHPLGNRRTCFLVTHRRHIYPPRRRERFHSAWWLGHASLAQDASPVHSLTDVKVLSQPAAENPVPASVLRHPHSAPHPQPLLLGTHAQQMPTAAVSHAPSRSSPQPLQIPPSSCPHAQGQSSPGDTRSGLIRQDLPHQTAPIDLSLDPAAFPNYSATISPDPGCSSIAPVVVSRSLTRIAVARTPTMPPSHAVLHVIRVAPTSSDSYTLAHDQS